MLLRFFSQVNSAKIQYFETTHTYSSPFIVLKGLMFSLLIYHFQGLSSLPSFSQSRFLLCHFSFPLYCNLPFIIIQFKIRPRTLAMYYVLSYQINLESAAVGTTFYSSLSLFPPIPKRIQKNHACQKFLIGDQAVGKHSSPLISFHLNL